VRKFGVFSSFVLISAITAGLYGVLHDQVTYTISPEYFTAFKFKQFNIYPQQFGNARIAVGVIGFLASWWMGIFLGLLLGATALIFKTHQQMKTELRKVLSFILLIVFAFGGIGYLLSKFHFISLELPWGVTDELADKDAFFDVASIHNFSYIGGGIGLLAGIIYLVFRWRKTRDIV
jgi:hypothetical protein